MSSEETEGVAPGSGRADELNLADPKAMRAMAHPMRMALLELLAVTPTLTATQASEVLGESPANCAFHLRTLAKYGFVREAGGGKGRERPWTRAHQSITLTTTGLADKSTELAATALAQVWLERALERIRRVFAANSWPQGWEDTVRSSDTVRFLTAEEAKGISEELLKALDSYGERTRDPAARPVGALPVHFDHFVYPMPELADLGAREAGDQGGPGAEDGGHPGSDDTANDDTANDDDQDEHEEN
jgi:predicted transcriptional regulator